MTSKRMSRREFLRLAAIGAVGAGLAACGAPATPELEEPTEEVAPTEEPEEAEEVEPSPIPEEEGPAKITIWGWPTHVMRSRDAEGNDLFAQRILEDTGVEVEQTLVQFQDYFAALKAAIPAGTGPDVLALPYPGTGFVWEFMTPLNVFGEAEWGSSWKEDLFVEAALTEMSLEAWLGGYGEDEALVMPGNMQLLGWFYYWIEDFEANGIDKDTLKTWEDLEKVVGILQAAGLTALAPSPHSASFPDWFSSMAEVVAPGKRDQVQRGNGKFTDPDIVEAWTLIAQVFNEFMPEGSLGMDASAGGSMFHNHEAVIATQFAGTPWLGNLNSDNPDIRDQMNNSYGTFVTPGSKGLASLDAGVGIVKESQNKEAAWEFCKWDSVGNGAKYMSELGDPVALKALTPAPKGTDFDTNLGTPLYTALKEGDNVFRYVLCTDVYQSLTDILPGVVTGQITGEQAAAEVQDVLDTYCGVWLA